MSTFRMDDPANTELTDDELNAVREKLLWIEHMDADGASIDDMAAAILEAHRGSSIHVPRFKPGVLVHRARQVMERPKNLDDLTYPPPDFAKTNRLSAQGECLFYGSFDGVAACLYECGAKTNDYFVVSTWVSVEPVSFVCLGFTGEAMEGLGGKRKARQAYLSPQEDPLGHLLADWQSKILTRPVRAGDELRYRLSTALARVGLRDSSRADGILYPSVAMDLCGDNVAIRPEVVDKCFAFHRCTICVLAGS